MYFYRIRPIIFIARPSFKNDEDCLLAKYQKLTRVYLHVKKELPSYF